MKRDPSDRSKDAFSAGGRAANNAAKFAVTEGSKPSKKKPSKKTHQRAPEDVADRKWKTVRFGNSTRRQGVAWVKLVA